ncbi:MAG: hypothetical protein GC185_09200 [Alphaproteobacteria bacterium]|nr:hypothetical protein [Alphaproteobacteria bacterium]
MKLKLKKKPTLILAAFVAVSGLCALLAFSPLAFSGDKAAPDAKADKGKVFDDWRVTCRKNPKDAKKQTCLMTQSIAFKQIKANALSTVIHTGKSKGKDGKVKELTFITLITPLGTQLLSGIALKIDDGKEYKEPYTMCNRAGCQVGMVFGDKMIDSLKSGSKMLVAYKVPGNKTVKAEVSLKGFTQALKAVTEGTN